LPGAKATDRRGSLSPPNAAFGLLIIDIKTAVA
jgi:hypothetical protein